MKRKVVIAILKYAFGIGVLAVVVALNWSVKGPDGEERGLSAAFDRPFHYVPFSLGLLICLCGVLLTFVRWYVLVRAQDLPFTLTDSLRLGLIGFYFSTFLPGSIGGDVVKAACLMREQSRRTVAVATILLDRALGLCGLFWLVAVSGAFSWVLGGFQNLAPATAAFMETVTIAGCSVVAGSIVFWLSLGAVSPHVSVRIAGRLGRIPKVGGLLAEFWGAVRLYRNRGPAIALAMLLAMIGHVAFVAVYYLSAQTLRLPQEDIPSLVSHFLFVPIGMTIQAGFPTPSGIGGSELAFGWLYSQFGPRLFILGVLAALVQRFITWILGLLGFLFYLQMRPVLRAAPTLESAAATTAAAQEGNSPEVRIIS